MKKHIALLMLVVCPLCFASLKDPTKPQNYQAQNGSECDGIINVASILYSKNRKLVVIDGEYYAEGEVVNGYEVKKINRDSVIFADSDREIERQVFDSKQCTSSDSLMSDIPRKQEQIEKESAPKERVRENLNEEN